MKRHNGKKEKMPKDRTKTTNSSGGGGVATAVRMVGTTSPQRPGAPTGQRPGGMPSRSPVSPTTIKPNGPGATTAGPATDHTHAARSAQVAIKNDPSSPENYAVLAGALRMLAQFLRTRNPEGADSLMNMACAAAWESKRLSPQAISSSRTMQEVKILVAWLRAKDHLTPEACDDMMDQIHSEYLSKALDGTTPLPIVTGF